MDPLVEIPISEWPRVQDMYEDYMTTHAEVYCLLDTQLSNPELIQFFDVHVYSVKGQLYNGVVIISDREGYYQVFIQPLEDIAPIEQALLETRVIDWNREVMVPSASARVADLLNRIIPKLGIDITLKYGSRKFCYPASLKDEALKKCSVPSNTYGGPMKPEHLNFVDKTWPYHNAISYRFFEALMREGLTYCLFTSDDNPIAWTALNESGALTHLYCVEAHRRKGFAEYFTYVATKDLVEKGKNVLAYTVEENTKAKDLFRKIGYQDHGLHYWVFLKKS